MRSSGNLLGGRCSACEGRRRLDRKGAGWGRRLVVEAPPGQVDRLCSEDVFSSSSVNYSILKVEHSYDSQRRLTDNGVKSAKQCLGGNFRDRVFRYFV